MKDIELLKQKTSAKEQEQSIDQKFGELKKSLANQMDDVYTNVDKKLGKVME